MLLAYYGGRTYPEVPQLLHTPLGIGQTRQEPPLGIGQTRQEPPPGRVRDRVGVGRWTANRWALRLAAVVALAAAVAFGTIAVRNGQQLGAVRDELNSARAAYQPVARVLAEPDARVGTATSSAGGRGLLISSRQLDRAVLVVSGMPAAPHGGSTRRGRWATAAHTRSAC